jgi:RNA-directed DNA polymerase
MAAQIELAELFQAYDDCRKYKRNTMNALAFEVDYENNLLKLCAEINNGTYQPGRSVAFIVTQPVTREIFAADFRDRVVHHLVINKLNPLFEREFIYDSYACRLGRGTSFGIKRLDSFIRCCSQNYSQDCYVLKLDIAGFFMHINQDILVEKLAKFIHEKYVYADKWLLLELCKKIIYNNATKNCVIKSKQCAWNTLPTNKSLFYSTYRCGLPIGNLTSQIFANFYMNTLDHFVKSNLGVRFYGRYVDDCVLVHQDKEYLKLLITKIRVFLNLHLKLTLHPKKIYLQHYTKGIKFLGVVLKPGRIYIANRTKGNFYQAISKQNIIITQHKPLASELMAFLCSMNSYLGLTEQYNSYRIRQQIVLQKLAEQWWDYVFLSADSTKFVVRNKSY